MANETPVPVQHVNEEVLKKVLEAGKRLESLSRDEIRAKFAKRAEQRLPYVVSYEARVARAEKLSAEDMSIRINARD